MMKDNNISPCSGVICGMGGSNEDIIDMAFALEPSMLIAFLLIFTSY